MKLVVHVKDEGQVENVYRAIDEAVGQEPSSMKRMRRRVRRYGRAGLRALLWMSVGAGGLFALGVWLVSRGGRP